MPQPCLHICGERVSTFRHRLASGELRDVDIYSSPMEWNGRPYLLSSIQDVTERMRLEDQLRQAQKMEAVGQLSGAIAHDFNNLLTNIMGFASLIQEDQPPESPSRRHADQVVRTSSRAADLTRQLLAFSRRQMLQPQVLSPSHLLLEMEVLLKHAVGERVRLQWDLAPDTGNVCADPTQLQQVVMNLVVTARDAMPQGGTLTFTTGIVAHGLGAELPDDPRAAFLAKPFTLHQLAGALARVLTAR